MQERSASPPLGNILIFVAILVAALGYMWVMGKFFPPPKVANPPAVEQSKDNKGGVEKKVAVDKAGGDKKPEKDKEKSGDQAKVSGKGDKPKAEAGKNEKIAVPPNGVVAPPKKGPRRWVALGSVAPDRKNPYRMLVTLCNEGASLARLELSSERYCDLEDRSGYLGHLVMDDSDKGPGCLVQVVGAGTPAEKAGVQPGDRILKLNYGGKATEIKDAQSPRKDAKSLEEALRQTKPGETVELVIQDAKGGIRSTEVTLVRRPLEVIRPERKKPTIDWIPGGPPDAISWDENCPPSLLTTLQQFVDKDKKYELRTDEDPDAKMEEELTQQLPGVDLRELNWDIDEKSIKRDKDQPGDPITKVAFSGIVAKYHLKLTKTYELAKVDGEPTTDVDAKAYHLQLTLEITNQDSKPHQVAYRQDGPNGLPVEGSWYASKVQKSGVGLRDVVYQLNRSDFQMVACSELSEKNEKFRKDLAESTQFSGDHLPLFFGVDAQYFSAALLPDRSTAAQIDRAVALRVGQINEQRKTLTNTTCRLISTPVTIEPDKSFVATYDLFAGPKRPTLLAKYDMQGLVYYGWFGWVAVPMTKILDFFYWAVPNYGLAIIMLTIVVRLAMFPVSRKQAQNAQMMQKIQPEMKEIQKKFKKDPEGARKAQQELWAKHNYNPFGSCLPMFFQIPIFLGLYRALQVNVELRGAPLISRGILWSSNLAAPDMLYDWSWFMPAAVSSGVGYPWFPLFGSMCGLGPYLNLLPIITIALFLIQQKVMMPPAADEQAAQQQKIMKYVMILMALMFYKVAAGLCIYFVASTLWGLTERRFLPKLAPAGGDAGGDDDDEPRRPAPKSDRLSSIERAAIRRKKGRKK